MWYIVFDYPFVYLLFIYLLETHDILLDTHFPDNAIKLLSTPPIVPTAPNQKYYHK